MMATYPGHIVVPTLDVDLAWHTQQLAPPLYYDWMRSQTGKFTDHDDKIAEVKLTSAFEWTSKTYQEIYNEIYSECTCWYCESIRESHVSSIGQFLGVSKNEKCESVPFPSSVLYICENHLLTRPFFAVAKSFHQSGHANLCPPDASAHISAHNAVKLKPVSSSDADIRRQSLLRIQQRLDEQYRKAQKRAQKKGHEIPPRDEYYHNHWGYPYMMYGPWVSTYPQVITASLFVLNFETINILLGID